MNSLRESGEVTELRSKALNERLAHMHDALKAELGHVNERHTKLVGDLTHQAERADHASSGAEKERLLAAAEHMKQLDGKLDVLHTNLKSELTAVSEQREALKSMDEAEANSKIDSVGERVEALLEAMKREFAGIEESANRLKSDKSREALLIETGRNQRMDAMHAKIDELQSTLSSHAQTSASEMGEVLDGLKDDLSVMKEKQSELAVATQEEIDARLDGFMERLKTETERQHKIKEENEEEAKRRLDEAVAKAAEEARLAAEAKAKAQAEALAEANQMDSVEKMTLTLANDPLVRGALDGLGDGGGSVDEHGNEKTGDGQPPMSPGHVLRAILTAVANRDEQRQGQQQAEPSQMQRAIASLRNAVLHALIDKIEEVKGPDRVNVQRTNVLDSPVMGMLLTDLENGSPLEPTLVAITSSIPLGSTDPTHPAVGLNTAETLSICRDPEVVAAASRLQEMSEHFHRRQRVLASIISASLRKDGANEETNAEITDALVDALEEDSEVMDALEALEEEDEDSSDEQTRRAEAVSHIMRAANGKKASTAFIQGLGKQAAADAAAESEQGSVGGSPARRPVSPMEQMVGLSRGLGHLVGSRGSVQIDNEALPPSVLHRGDTQGALALLQVREIASRPPMPRPPRPPQPP